jgi:hypothetical protein
MRKTGLVIVAAAAAFAMTIAGAKAKSCSDVLNTCMKMYAGQVHGKQGAGPDAETQCRNDFNGCMQTGTWAGSTTTIKGLQKK